MYVFYCCMTINDSNNCIVIIRKELGKIIAQLINTGVELPWYFPYYF